MTISITYRLLKITIKTTDKPTQAITATGTTMAGIGTPLDPLFSEAAILYFPGTELFSTVSVVIPDVMSVLISDVMSVVIPDVKSVVIPDVNTLITATVIGVSEGVVVVVKEAVDSLKVETVRFVSFAVTVVPALIAVIEVVDILL